MKHFELGEETEYKGYTVKIKNDDLDTVNPRKDYDYLSTMICAHRRYELGDVQASSGQEIVDLIEDLETSGGLWLPLYLYDHSGITMRTTKFSCPWDSGQVGIIYVTREKILKEYSCKRVTKKIKEKVYAVMNAEVKEYDYYLTGNVWGYVIEDENGDDVDSCWGFLGDGFDGSLDYMEEQIIGQIEWHVNDKRKKQQDQLKVLIKNKVPLINRQQIMANV